MYEQQNCDNNDKKRNTSHARLDQLARPPRVN